MCRSKFASVHWALVRGIVVQESNEEEKFVGYAIRGIHSDYRHRSTYWKLDSRKLLPQEIGDEEELVEFLETARGNDHQVHLVTNKRQPHPAAVIPPIVEEDD